MPKRKAEDEMPKPVAAKKTKTPPKVNNEAAVSYSSAQKSALSEFSQVTQSDKNVASRLLKANNWNVSAAVNAFFSSSSNGAPNPLRANISKLFDKYRDDPRNEPDEINAEGTQKLLGEMNIGLDDIGAFVFSDLVGSPTLGKITREGFLEGCLEASADTTAKIRNVVLQRRSQLQTDKAVFRPIYEHAFQLGLANNAKALGQEEAREFWTLLFSTQGYSWRTKKSPWLDWWLEFQEQKWKKAVNKDLWKQTLSFADQTLKDESLSFWTEDSSWPSVIDDFVEYVKTEKRPAPPAAGGDAMDVE